MDISNKLREMSDGEKVGLGLLVAFFGSKILGAAGKIIFFFVWLAVIVAFIGFCLLMAWLTGGA